MQWMPCARPISRFLWNRTECELRGDYSDCKDTSSAEHLRQGWDVRRSQSELLRCARHRPGGRSDPRIRLRARRIGGYRVSLPDRDRLSATAHVRFSADK